MKTQYVYSELDVVPGPVGKVAPVNMHTHRIQEFQLDELAVAERPATRIMRLVAPIRGRHDRR